MFGMTLSSFFLQQRRGGLFFCERHIHFCRDPLYDVSQTLLITNLSLSVPQKKKHLRTLTVQLPSWILQRARLPFNPIGRGRRPPSQGLILPEVSSSLTCHSHQMLPQLTSEVCEQRLSSYYSETFNNTVSNFSVDFKVEVRP